MQLSEGGTSDKAASFYLLCLQLRLEAVPPGGRAKRLFVCAKDCVVTLLGLLLNRS